MSRMGYVFLGLVVLVLVTLFNLEHVNDRSGDRGWRSSGSSGSGSWSSGGGHK